VAWEIPLGEDHSPAGLQQAVLRTKLRPPLERWFPVDARLAGRLQPQPGDLVIVHAPAGYGKTTALAASQGPGWLWYSLDWSDSRPLTLAGRVTAALGLEPIKAGSPLSGEAVAAELAERLSDRPLTITFDRYEQLGEAREVGRFVSELLQLVPSFSLRLATRTRPHLPLERLGLEGHLVDVGPDDLRLDRSQIKTILTAGWRRPPTGDELEFADSTIQGWPAALPLWLINHESGADLMAPVRPGMPLHNYLDEELLQRTLTPEVQERLWSDPAWLVGPGPLFDRASTDDRRRLADVLVRDRVGVVRGNAGWQLHPLVRRFIEMRIPVAGQPPPRVTSSRPQPALHIRTFGGLAVSMRGAAIDQTTWPRGALRLLELLLCLPDHRVNATQAARSLWPRHLAGSAVNSFNVALHALRRVLDPDLVVAAESRLVVHEGRSYRLRVDAIDCDVDEFVRLVSRQSEPLDESGASRVAAATDLYRGDFLTESTEPFVVERRARLERQALEALERLGDWSSEVGHQEEAVAAYNRLLELAPAREDIWARVLDLHLDAGDEYGALAALQRCEQSLQAAETEPSGLLRELSRRVRRTDGYRG
jgi:DNA-binding SARP family transcriptional activator